MGNDDHSHSDAFLFLEIYSGLLHLTPFTYREWLLCRKQKENARVLFFHFTFLEIYLVGLYLASVHPRLRQTALAGEKTDPERSLHFPHLQVRAAILEFHNVLSQSQVNTK